MGVGSVQNQKQQEEEGCVALSSSAPTVVTVVPTDYPNRVFSDNEILDPRMPVGCRKPQQQPSQPLIGQPVMSAQSPALQRIQKGYEIAS